MGRSGRHGRRGEPGGPVVVGAPGPDHNGPMRRDPGSPPALAAGAALELADYRRRVAELYLELRAGGIDETSWRRWRTARSQLLATHSQSPLDDDRRAAPEPLPFFPYDPSWQVVGTLEPFQGAPPSASVAEGASTFAPIAVVCFERAGIEHRLTLYWLEAYGGGLFLPFADGTNGTSTYGGGRYLLDGAKSADLGSPGPGQLLLDFNLAYHPSCTWDPRWPCPLAPPTNRLDVAVEAGERLMAETVSQG